jgi:hypothetical protein
MYNDENYVVMYQTFFLIINTLNMQNYPVIKLGNLCPLFRKPRGLSSRAIYTD